MKKTFMDDFILKNYFNSLTLYNIRTETKISREKSSNFLEKQKIQTKVHFFTKL